MPLARNWTACSGVLFNYFQCSGLLCLFFVVFFVQFRLCNQRLLRSLCSQRRSSTFAKRQTRRLSFFTQNGLNSACAIKECFVLFAYAPFATAAGYGFANARRLIAAVLLFTHLMEQECSQKCVALICSLFLFTCIPPYP